MEKKTLKVYISNDTKSLSLMDRFEGIGNGDRYDQMHIMNRNYYWMDNIGSIAYQLVIERCKPNTETVGDITFTNFKKGYTGALDSYVRNQLTDKVVAEYSGKGKVFYFDKPFHLRAQNSSNRTGYGWEWDWTNGFGSYTEGTYYGETTDYVFTGVYIA